MESVYEDFEDRDLASLDAEYQQYTLGGFTLPMKHPALDFSVCLCNLPGKSCPQDQELIEFSLVSWRTFLHTTSLRGDSRMAGLNASEPRGVFHCRCYQTCTSKFHLARVSERRLGQSDLSSMNPAFSSVYKLERSSTVAAADLSSDQTSAAPPTAPPRSSRSTAAAAAARGFTGKCLFCKAVDKKVGDNTGKRRKVGKLSRCMTKEAAEAIHRSAEIYNDEDMLLLTRVSKDFVALEIQYHRSCYSEYTHKKKLTAAQKVASGVAEQGDKGTIYA